MKHNDLPERCGQYVDKDHHLLRFSEDLTCIKNGIIYGDENGCG